MAKNISKVTRRDLSILLTRGWDTEDIFGGCVHMYYDIWGLLTPPEFLNRLYPLQFLPSYDSRVDNAECDIHLHTVTNPNDYDYDWFWTDDRFNIGNGEDEQILNFIVEIFHPEVRNDKYDWRSLLTQINELLYPDGYKIVAVDKISGRDVYGWKPTKRDLVLITEKEIAFFGSIFNHGGYVLGFNKRNEFNDFTEDSIGIRLCDVYNSSMGKSLSAFLKEGDEDKVIKLITDLWNLGVSLPDSYIPQNDFAEGQSVINRISNVNLVVINQIAEIKERFDNSYIQRQIDEMLASQDSDPTNAIGLAKELIESCCKTILEYYTLPTNYDTLSKLVKATTKTLKITPEDIPDDIPEAKSMKSILGAFATISDGLANLRNTYGRGHGKDNKYKELSVRHAKLAVGASSTLVHFLWDSFSRKNPISK